MRISQSDIPHVLTRPEYLRGNGNTDDNECATMFKDYQKCLQVGIDETQLVALESNPVWCIGCSPGAQDRQALERSARR